MGRVNKLIEGVFTKICFNNQLVPEHVVFSKQQDNLVLPSSALKKYTNRYDGLTNTIWKELSDLAELESLIMQLRTYENLDCSNIKLNVLRNSYVYARVPFYRKNKDTNDIRVIVSTTEGWGKSVTKLRKNKEYMEMAKNKLLKQMKLEIDKSIKHVDKFKDKTLVVK